jgi:hypothetical protein
LPQMPQTDSVLSGSALRYCPSGNLGLERNPRQLGLGSPERREKP